MSATSATPSFGRYTNAVMLGKGGMGAVYRATDPLLGRSVAIKVLTQRDPKYVERFRREAQVLARIAHPAIIQIHEIVGGDDGSNPYIVMEFFEGRALDAVLRDGPLPPSEAVRVVRQVAEGLRKAHANEVVHRDIKPANIMLSGAGEVKILDFGIAKLRDATTDLTGDTVLGTPYYMSPEQALGQAIDARTDIYSLGITAFHLLTGRRPFEAKNKVDAMMMQVKTPLPDLRQFGRCDERIAAIVARMCAKKAVDRYRDCDELLEALDALPRALGGKQPEHSAEPSAVAAAPEPKTVVMARPPSPPPRPAVSAESRPLHPGKQPHSAPAAPQVPSAAGYGRRPTRREPPKRMRAVATGTAAALILLGVGGWALAAQRASRARVPAGGWHRAKGMKRLHASGYSNCVFSARALERGREDEGALEQSFSASDPIYGRCYLPAAPGPNRPGEIWAEIWIDGTKRQHLVYDPPILPEQDEIPLEWSREQPSRLPELSAGQHTVSVWIYRQSNDRHNPVALAAGELVVRR